MDEHLRGIPLRGLSIEELEAKQAALGKYIKAKKAEISKDARKKEDRRKILVGAYVLKLVSEGNADAKRILEGIGEYLTRPKDRELFGLDNAPQDADNADTDGTFSWDWDEQGRIYLNVPYNPNGPNPEKDEVKRLGANYDPQRTAWYIVRDQNDPALFTRWMPKS